MDLIDNGYLKPYYKHIIASAKNKLEDDGVFTVLDTVVDGFTVKSDWPGMAVVVIDENAPYDGGRRQIPSIISVDGNDYDVVMTYVKKNAPYCYGTSFILPDNGSTVCLEGRIGSSIGTGTAHVGLLCNKSNPIFSCRNYNLYSKDFTEVYHYNGEVDRVGTLNGPTLEDSLKVIHEKACCAFVWDVLRLPDGLKLIEDDAFKYASVNTIDFGLSLPTIDGGVPSFLEQFCYPPKKIKLNRLQKDIPQNYIPSNYRKFWSLILKAPELCDKPSLPETIRVTDVITDEVITLLIHDIENYKSANREVYDGIINTTLIRLKDTPSRIEHYVEVYEPIDLVKTKIKEASVYF